jgi:hypothetical protein
MLHLSTECYVKTAHPQCVDVAIRKISSVKDDRLETRTASSGMDVS